MSIFGPLMADAAISYLESNEDDIREFCRIARALPGAPRGIDLVLTAVRWCIRHGRPNEAKVRKALKL